MTNGFDTLFLLSADASIGIHPVELPLESFWVVPFPVVVDLFPPFVVDSWVDVALQGCREIVFKCLLLDYYLEPQAIYRRFVTLPPTS